MTFRIIEDNVSLLGGVDIIINRHRITATKEEAVISFRHYLGLEHSKKDCPFCQRGFK